MTLSRIRSQFEALKRKYARVIAAATLKPVANKITRLWEIAVKKKQPKPNPVICIHEVVDAGSRLKTFNALHAYIDDCRCYDNLPNTDEIIDRLLSPNERVDLYEVLPNRSPVS